MSETTKEYLVRLPQSICEDADEAQSALAAGMVDGEGHSTVPLVYLTDEMCERASRVFKWVLESDEVATPPTPDRAAVRTALVRILRESEAHAAINDLTELLGVNDLEADTEDNIADALLRPAPAADGEADVRQTLSDVVGCCQAAERDALRWLYVLRHGSLGLDEENELVLLFSFGPADDAPYLSADEVDEVSGNKPNAKGWVRGEVLNRAIDYVRGEHALGMPPAPPCIHERELLALRPAPLPADAKRDAQEAAWFRWLRDNPQAAAFTAVNVAKWVPAGPDLGATMASGTVVGEMEDAKNPEYRYHIAASSLPADVQAVVARVRADIEDAYADPSGRIASCYVSDLEVLLAAVSRPAEIVAQDGGSSVPTPEDLAFRRGVYAERAEWRKATGAAHWSEVSRPAEARGEPVAWGLRDKTTGRINAARGQLVNAEEIRDHLLAQHIDVELVPLYAHSAPSGGDAAPRPETGEDTKRLDALESLRSWAGFNEFSRAYRSKAYVRHVKAMPCYACGVVGETDAAHGETGGMGYKAGWETLLPLCRRCHTKQHQSGWLAIGMTEESRTRAARMARDTFEERYAEGE